MPDGAEPFGQPPETVVPSALPPSERDEFLTARPAALVELFHRISFLVLLVALAVAVVSPALARPKPPKPTGDAATAPVQPTAPPGPEALAMLDAAIADGRLDNARALIAPMWASGAPSVQLRAAELALAGGSLPEAAEAFTGLIDGPLAALARQGLGITRLREGKEAEARPLLEQAVAADPGLARAWNALGVLADKARDWPAADLAYGKAVAAAPQDAGILANRGWSQLLRGHHEAAERDLVAALKLQPSLKPARTNLALARAMQGRYQEAFLLSDKASLATDLNTVGYAAMMRGDLSVAEAYFNRALSLNPQFDRAAWANLQYLAELKAQKVREPTGAAKIMTLADAGLWLMMLSVLASAAFDLRTFEIPDTITVLIIIGAVLFGLGTPGFDWASHAAAGGAFFAFGLLAFARGWLGGGDVKVMTGCACWATLGTLAAQVVLIAIAGGVLALVLMLLRRGLILAGVTGDDAPRLVRVGADLPYAVAIAAGMAVWGWRFLPLP